MRRHHRWSEEEKAYLRKIAKNTPIKQIQEMMSRKFDYEFSRGQITKAMFRFGALNGNDPRFKKGDEPWNKGKKMNIDPWNKGKRLGPAYNRSDIGTEHIDTKGFIHVKVSNPSGWKLKHHLIYEKHYGPIEEGYLVIFADKNKNNFDINNLIKIKKSELLTINSNGLYYDNAELTKVGVNVAKVIEMINKKK